MISMMNVPLRTDIADPATLLSAVHEESVEAKAYAEALGSKLILEMTESIPVAIQSNIMQLAVRGGLAEKNVVMNTIVTNVPGSPIQLYLCGAPLISSIGIGPLAPGVGLFHTVNSGMMDQEGKIILSFIACRDVMPDPEWYAACIQQSFDELYSATVQPRRKKKVSAARKPKKKAAVRKTRSSSARMKPRGRTR